TRPEQGLDGGSVAQFGDKPDLVLGYRSGVPIIRNAENFNAPLGHGCGGNDRRRPAIRGQLLRFRAVSSVGDDPDHRLVHSPRQGSMMVARRFLGSRTPSGVGTAGLSLPCQASATALAGTPSFTSSPRTASARRLLRPML